MAAVSIPNSPHSLSAMSSRRVPLSSNPNAANSPYRAVAAAAAATQKQQKRSYATIQREEPYGQPPPKKQLLETQYISKSPSRTSAAQAAEGRVFTRRSNVAQTTAFEKKLEAARMRPAQQQTVTRAEKHSEENLETIRQWQRHYRRVFPKFVFYFESVAEDARSRLTRQMQQLGAREEKFFSNEVTHVVTTRSIPPPMPQNTVESCVESSSHDMHAQNISHPIQTINPLLLDRSSESAGAHYDSAAKKFTFEAPLARRAASNTHDLDIRRQQVRNADVLIKARDLGMKIWALEKLQRMMTTMFETDAGAQMVHGHNTRSNPTVVDTAMISRSVRNADLSQLLRNERINGPSDRDPTVASKEMVLFKGPFIYIHDIDEKQRPIMVREYAKVSNKEDGDWPQFRSVANGKCPFVEEIDHDRREQERELFRQQKQAERNRAAVDAPRTRAAAAEARMQPPSKQHLSQTADAGNRLKQAEQFVVPDKQRVIVEPSSTRGPQNAFVSRAEQGRLFGGEPVASGVQPSNVTSAIRSQMISSTAAAPGAKAGTSKEVHGLQRKVLERNSGPTSLGHPTSLGLTSSHRMTDIAATAAKEEQNSKVAKRRAQEKLGFVDEDPTPTELEDARRQETERKTRAVQKRKSEKRDPKPGYCENCMDKFEDFDEHIQSRKHRKFAEKQENWMELDALLSQLVRPVKDVDLDEY